MFQIVSRASLLHDQVNYVFHLVPNFCAFALLADQVNYVLVLCQGVGALYPLTFKKGSKCLFLYMYITFNLNTLKTSNIFYSVHIKTHY